MMRIMCFALFMSLLTFTPVIQQDRGKEPKNEIVILITPQDKDYTYNPHLWFILEDGLYLSTSHVKNPQYSDEMLTFQRIDLKNK